MPKKKNNNLGKLKRIEQGADPSTVGLIKPKIKPNDLHEKEPEEFVHNKIKPTRKKD